MTTPTRVIYGDPKDYPFKHLIADNKDDDETRRSIKPIVTHLKDHTAPHTICDKEQLGADGKYRTPKLIHQAQARGFKSPMEMYESDKKDAEEKKLKETDDLRKQVADLTALVQQLLKKQ